MPTDAPEHDTLNQERDEILQRVERWIEVPMAVLGLAWLALVVVDLVRGLPPLLETVSTAIWVVFLLDFALKFALAPRRLAFLRSHWLTALSLLVPAVRVFRAVQVVRVLRAARAARGLTLVRVVGSLNRSMRALGTSLGRRGFGYVVALTAAVTLGGAAGMYAFERDAPGGPGFPDFGAALWWTAMVMTTMGSDYWPRTPEGRVLCLLLSLYAFAVFGYVTASLATFFVGRDAARADDADEVTPPVAALREEIAALREEIRALRGALRLDADDPAE